MGEFDQGEIEAFAIGFGGFERKCIPDNETNRECILVSRWFDADAIVERAGASLRTAPTCLSDNIHQLRGSSQIIAGTKSARQIRATLRSAGGT